MASFGAKIDRLPTAGPYCFRIQGSVYHRTCHPHPPTNDVPKFAQLYILDDSDALEHRLQDPANQQCQRTIMEELGRLLAEHNPYIHAYKTMRELELEEQERSVREGRQPNQVIIDFVQDRNTDRRRYNRPTTNEVAIVFQADENGEPPKNRDMRIYPRGDSLLQIHQTSPLVDPFDLSLFFFHGELGWDSNIPLMTEQTRNRRERVTQLQYYSHMVSVRDQFSPIHYGGKLFQQFLVDAYARTEGNRLHYIVTHQTELMAKSYLGLRDHIANIANANNAMAGRMVILPSTFPGGPRYMHQNYQDAMAVVASTGRPDFFITMTANPRYREIVENLYPGQTASDRPDIVARVFKMKMDSLKKFLKDGFFGAVEAMLDVVEFQKRGLPHMHCLVTNKSSSKVRTADEIDKFVSAELPNPASHPRLYALVKKLMIHTPCGTENGNPFAVCLDENGLCTKRFSKEYSEITVQNVDGYPLYQRRNNGIFFLMKKKTGRGSVRVDNRWVVPYNPFLPYTYNCHINIEVCASVKSIKYIYKYVYKGHDAANIRIRSDGTSVVNYDEVDNYLNCRYVSPPEAIWRLFEYPLHNRSHAVVRLAVHLPNAQNVTFRRGNEEQALAVSTSTLLAWFTLNEDDADARGYKYTQIPYHYTFITTRKPIYWRRRRRRQRMVSRMYTVPPSDPERFFLRLLLLHVTGARNYNDIKLVRGVQHLTFRAAAQARHLLDDDSELSRCLREAETQQMPYNMRELFAFLLIYASPSDPRELWESFKQSMSEDFTSQGIDIDVSYNLSLAQIQRVLAQNGRRCHDFMLPNPPSEIHPEAPVSIQREEILSHEMIRSLRPQQYQAFRSIISAIDSRHQRAKCFFLDAPAGTGKSYIFGTLIHYLLSREQLAVVIAATGIAATLLKGGKTAHSRFKIPIPAVESSTSMMKINSPEADVLRAANLILWDEATMSTAHMLAVVDRLLRFLKNSNIPFGGIPIVLAGDFRQTLPVVRRGDRTRIIEACIKTSHLWKHFQTVPLTENIRLRQGEGDFASFLMKIGNGERIARVGNLSNDFVQLPPQCIAHVNLVDIIFGDIENLTLEELASRVILCPLNEDTIVINNQIVDRLPQEATEYLSADSVDTDEPNEAVMYTTEYLNSLTPPGLPPHRLILKIGTIIMLLRNLSAENGLVNGTRLIVTGLLEHVIIAKVVTGSVAGKVVFIPRIVLQPSDTGLPFVLRRRQFPVRIAFAMTINRSQGQTFEKVGVYPVFTHGQLYVAFSRAKSLSDLYVYVVPSSQQGQLARRSNAVFTKNIVYREVIE